MLSLHFFSEFRTKACSHRSGFMDQWVIFGYQVQLTSYFLQRYRNNFIVSERYHIDRTVPERLSSTLCVYAVITDRIQGSRRKSTATIANIFGINESV